MSKILLALHDKGTFDGFRMYAKAKGSEILVPTRMDVESTIEALLQNPDQVLMDVNLGLKGSDDYTSFLKVEEAMRSRGYDTKIKLLGVSAKPNLISDIKSDHPNFYVAEKSDSNIVYSFLKSQ